MIVIVIKITLSKRHYDSPSLIGFIEENICLFVNIYMKVHL